MFDESDESEDGGGERRERRRKDSGASEQQEEEVTAQRLSNLSNSKYHRCKYDNPPFLLCLPGWSKEDCKPILVHRESHTDTRQWEHQHRSSGIPACDHILSSIEEIPPSTHLVLFPKYVFAIFNMIPTHPHSLHNAFSDRAATKGQLLGDGQPMGDLRLLRTV